MTLHILDDLEQGSDEWLDARRGIVTAPDWRHATACGHGLHFSPSPSGARRNYSGDGPPRFLLCSIPAAETVPLDDKCKARTCIVLAEVDQHRRRVEAVTA